MRHNIIKAFYKPLPRLLPHTLRSVFNWWGWRIQKRQRHLKALGLCSLVPPCMLSCMYTSVTNTHYFQYCTLWMSLINSYQTCYDENLDKDSESRQIKGSWNSSHPLHFHLFSPLYDLLTSKRLRVFHFNPTPLLSSLSVSLSHTRWVGVSPGWSSAWHSVKAYLHLLSLSEDRVYNPTEGQQLTGSSAPSAEINALYWFFFFFFWSYSRSGCRADPLCCDHYYL